MVGADQKARLKTIATKRSCEELLCTSSGGVLLAQSSRHSLSQGAVSSAPVGNAAPGGAGVNQVRAECRWEASRFES